MMCHDAAQRQAVQARRVSFIDALRLLRQMLVLPCAGEPDSRLAIDPYRAGRVEPRLVKRRRQRHYLTTPRGAARQRLYSQPLAA